MNERAYTVHKLVCGVPMIDLWTLDVGPPLLGADKILDLTQVVLFPG